MPRNANPKEPSKSAFFQQFQNVLVELPLFYQNYLMGKQKQIIKSKNMRFSQVFQSLTLNSFYSQQRAVFTAMSTLTEPSHKNLFDLSIFCLLICCKILNLVPNILLLMAKCSQSRRQRIDQLKATLSMENLLSTRPLYYIDRSFRHNEIERLSNAQKRMVSHTIDIFAQRSRKQFEQQLHAKQESNAQDYRHKLVQSMRNFQQSNSIHFFPSHTKPKMTNLALPQHIILERRYNSQMAYQLQSFLQGKRIQLNRSKLRREACPQPPPLLIEALKRVWNGRNTAASSHNSHFPPNNPSIHQQFNEKKLNKSIKNGQQCQQELKKSIGRQLMCYNSSQKQNKRMKVSA